MIKFYVLTLFEDMFTSFVNTSIIKRAIENQYVSVKTIDIRKFTNDKHNRVDFPPYGGGNGMIMSCIPLSNAIDYVVENYITSKRYKIIYMSPRGKVLNYNISKEFVTLADEYIIICGHYEGIDERVIEEYNMMEISIGDYVLTGGELASEVLMDSIIRLIPGVLTEGSLIEESHTNSLLEYPQYTKPYEFRGRKVPEILLSGNHKKISEYRKEEAIKITKKYRPDLYNAFKKENKN